MIRIFIPNSEKFFFATRNFMFDNFIAFSDQFWKIKIKWVNSVVVLFFDLFCRKNLRIELLKVVIQNYQWEKNHCWIFNLFYFFVELIK